MVVTNVWGGCERLQLRQGTGRTQCTPSYRAVVCTFFLDSIPHRDIVDIHGSRQAVVTKQNGRNHRLEKFMHAQPVVLKT